MGTLHNKSVVFSASNLSGVKFNVCLHALRTIHSTRTLKYSQNYLQT